MDMSEYQEKHEVCSSHGYYISKLVCFVKLFLFSLATVPGYKVCNAFWVCICSSASLIRWMPLHYSATLQSLTDSTFSSSGHTGCGFIDLFV